MTKKSSIIPASVPQTTPIALIYGVEDISFPFGSVIVLPSKRPCYLPSCEKHEAHYITPKRQELINAKEGETLSLTFCGGFYELFDRPPEPLSRQDRTWLDNVEILPPKKTISRGLASNCGLPRAPVRRTRDIGDPA
jgi:hypothetical protein